MFIQIETYISIFFYSISQSQKKFGACYILFFMCHKNVTVVELKKKSYEMIGREKNKINKQTDLLTSTVDVFKDQREVASLFMCKIYGCAASH